MRVVNRTFQTSVVANATGAYALWSINLSTFTEKHIIVEVESSAYDPLNGDVSIRYDIEGLYNDTGKTVSTLSNYQNERYSYNQGDSEPNPIAYVQASGILSQELQVLNSGSRTIKVISHVKLIAF